MIFLVTRDFGIRFLISLEDSLGNLLNEDS